MMRLSYIALLYGQMLTHCLPLQRSPASNDSMAGAATGKGKRGGMSQCLLLHIQSYDQLLLIRGVLLHLCTTHDDMVAAAE